MKNVTILCLTIIMILIMLLNDSSSMLCAAFLQIFCYVIHYLYVIIPVVTSISKKYVFL